MERALYNGVLSGVSLGGTHFFYENPLASRGTHHRQDWFDCACCPTNVVRLLPTLGAYAYSTSDTDLAVHLYLGGEAELSLGAPVTLRQETKYPWNGAISGIIGPATPTEFTSASASRAGVAQASLALNGHTLEPELERGYACLTRIWQPGDVVELNLPMPVEKIEAHPAVASCVGRLALQRGPLVYCLEDADHSVPVRELAVAPDADFTPRFDPDLLGGVVVLEGEGALRNAPAWEGALYLRQERHERVPNPGACHSLLRLGPPHPRRDAGVDPACHVRSWAMCEFCHQHGEGKKWYLQAKNYSADLLADVGRRRMIEEFFTQGPERLAEDGEQLKKLHAAPPLVQSAIKRAVTKKMKKQHFGQVLPLEDVARDLQVHRLHRAHGLHLPAPRLGQEARYCYGISLGRAASEFSRDPGPGG